MRNVEYGHGWWVLRACGRNPLVRGIDRLELFIIALGFLVVLTAAACAGALGTAVHDTRSREHIEQVQTRHTVIARAIDDSTIVASDDGSTTATRVNVRWQVDGTDRTDGLTVQDAVKTGDPLTIWVDGRGNRVGAPAPTSRAGADAVGVAYLAWQAVALAAAGLVRWGCSHLDGRRDAAWEHDIRCLINDDSGRKP
jgi:hypothetical protein